MSGTVVVGAGLSGLFTGAAFALRGAEVTVVDAGEVPGGVAATREESGYRLEPAAGTLSLPDPVVSPLLEWAGVAVAPAPAATRRWVRTGRGLVEVPGGPRALLAPLLPLPARLVALAEPFRAPVEDGDPSLEQLLTARLGRGAGSLVAGLMAAGVFAGDASRLSAAAAFPRLADLLRRHGSLARGAWRARRPGGPRPRAHVPVGGMRTAAQALARALGERYRPSFPVAAVSPAGRGWVVEGPEDLRADHVVLAVGPGEAADLVPDPGLASTLRRAVTAPVAVVFLGGRSEGLPLPDGFGYLPAPGFDGVVVGCLFESSIDPDRAPAGHSLVKVILGGAGRSPAVDADDDSLVSAAGEEVARALGRDIEASFARVARHRPGIPQYEVGHREWLGELDEALRRLPGLHLTGWGYRGVGVAQVAADAVRVAGAIAGGPDPGGRG